MNKILPDAYLKKYQQLWELIMQLENLLQKSPLVMTVVEENCQKLQDFYQQQIFPLGEEIFIEDIGGDGGLAVCSEIASRWRSLHTETHRSMKLLALDLSLLKAARSQQMQEVRKKGMTDRLATLTSYCQVLLTPDSTNPT